MSFPDFDRIAAARGDGLHPDLRALLERRAALAADPRIVAINVHDTGRPVFEGSGDGFVPGNVVRMEAARPAGAAAQIPARRPLQR